MRWAMFEVALPTVDCAAQEEFWRRMFDARTLFRGAVGGDRFVRLAVADLTLVFTETSSTPALPADDRFRHHLGLRVADLAAAITELEARGARFVLTPASARALASSGEEGAPFFRTDYIAPPLSRARIDAGEYRHAVAIIAAPDGLWVELNEVHEPPDTDWYAGSAARLTEEPTE